MPDGRRTLPRPSVDESTLPGVPSIEPILRLLAIALAVSGAAIGVYSLFDSDERSLLLAIGHLAVVALLAGPLLLKRGIHYFDPIVFVTLYTVIGSLMSAYYLVFADTDRRDFVMNGESFSFFVTGGLWTVLGLALTGLGYGLTSKRVRAERWIPNDSWLTSRVVLGASLIGVGLSVVGLIAFVQQTGGLSDVANISRKRVIAIETTSGDTVYGSGGYLIALTQVTVPLLMVVVGLVLRANKRLKFLPRLIILSLIVVSIALPLFSSSRSNVIFVFLGAALVGMVYGNIKPRHLVVTAGIAVVFFTTMTALRISSHGGDRAMGDTGGISPIESLASSTNGMSLVGTAHIIHYVPERMGYQYGRTYLTWIFAPVPRSLWPNKPDISLGKKIKEEVLEQPVIKSGRPPSIMSEGYVNFGVVGFFVASLLYGVALRLLANTFIPLLGTNVFITPLYFAFLTAMTSAVNSAFSQMVVRILTDLITLGVVVVLLFALSQLSRERGSGEAW